MYQGEKKMPEIAIGHGEALRRAEIRNHYLVPLYVSWTSDVPTPEAEAALQGVREALTASGQDRKIVAYGASPWGQGEYSSSDWYIQQALPLKGIVVMPD
ncbi:hypothetical protein HY411_00185 [Candidatus Gottesmanbacteria bacterium]|nr:hypothetical protein [Candidatus Gottesmanbacteria bacterium]